jgi:uncharacterized FlgJ-related protein
MSKYKLPLLILLLISIATASAQPGRQQMSVDDRAKRLDELIFTEVDDLKKKQKEKISAANLTMATKIEELRKSGDREKRRAGITEVNNSYKAEMKAILNEEQFVQFEKLMKERIQRRRSPRQ